MARGVDPKFASFSAYKEGRGRTNHCTALPPYSLEGGCHALFIRTTQKKESARHAQGPLFLG